MSWLRFVPLFALLLWGCDDVSSTTEPDAGRRALCADGETKCEGGMLRTCIEDGAGWLVTPCGEASLCVEGECVELTCAPGARECTDEGVRTCAADGSAWSDATPCGTDQTCVQGVCLDQSCTPGEQACAAKIALVCDDNALTWIRTPCAAHEICQDGECVEEMGAVRCPAGQTLCGPDGLYACAEDGLSWTETPCPDDQLCFEAVCVECVQDGDCAEAGVCVDGECKPPALAIADVPLVPGQIHVPYTHAFEARFGEAPYTWRLEADALPGGLELADNELTGTPQAAGRWPLTVHVEDATGATAQAERELVVHAEGLVISSDSPLAGAHEGEAYATQFEALGGVPPYGWILTEGRLPDGLQLSATGAVSGVPTEIGAFPFTLRVVDSGDPAGFAEKAFDFEVAVSPLQIVAEQSIDLFITQVIVLPTITVVENLPIPYETQLTAVGGLRPHLWSEQPIPDGVRAFLPQSGLPEGLTLDEDGRLHGAVVDPSLVISVPIPFTQIELTGFFFFAEVRDSQGVPDQDAAIYLLPTLPIGG